MAIQTVYYRQKIEQTGWRYRPVTVGRRPEAAKNAHYFIRIRNGAGKYLVTSSCLCKKFEGVGIPVLVNLIEDGSNPPSGRWLKTRFKGN
jgi:hypothetical protein